MRFLNQLREQFRKIYLGMSPARRATFIALTVCCLGVVGWVAYYAMQTEYRVLFSGLGPEDAGAVTTKLQSQGVSYRLSGGGGTILVPADQVQQLRLDLALEGLPSKGK